MLDKVIRRDAREDDVVTQAIDHDARASQRIVLRCLGIILINREPLNRQVHLANLESGEEHVIGDADLAGGLVVSDVEKLVLLR